MRFSFASANIDLFLYPPQDRLDFHAVPLRHSGGATPKLG